MMSWYGSCSGRGAMELRDVSPDQWEQIGRSLTSLTVCVGLGVGGAFALLFGRAVLPTIAADNLAGPVRWARRALMPLGALALFGAAVALAFGLTLAIDVLADIYPRFLI